MQWLTRCQICIAHRSKSTSAHLRWLAQSEEGTEFCQCHCSDVEINNYDELNNQSCAFLLGFLF